MPDEIVRIRIPSGHDLGKSHQVAGAFSANSFGADGPGGPVVIFRDLPQGKKEIVQVSPGLTGFQRIALNAAGIIVVHASQWFLTEVAPTIWQRIRTAVADRKQNSQVKTTPQRQEAELQIVEPVGATEPGSELAVGPERMTSSEWQEAFRNMLLAGGFTVAQWQRLSAAVIEDEGDENVAIAAQEEMRKLSPQKGVDEIGALFQSSPTLLSEGEAVEPMEISVAAAEPSYAPQRMMEPEGSDSSVNLQDDAPDGDESAN